MSLICHGTTSCSASEVGPFMQGISVACGNNGDCQLGDIMTVVANVGNYVLGLVGAVVLLMFVIGGFYMVTAAGNMDRVKTGKRYITTSIVGLLIVFGAFAAVQTLKGVLTGTTAVQNGGNYVVCTSAEDAGKACGLNSNCDSTGFVCMTKCDIQLGAQGYQCMTQNFNDPSTAGQNFQDCIAGLCAGGDEVQCCKLQ
jgi:hypothetical protein